MILPVSKTRKEHFWKKISPADLQHWCSPWQWLKNFQIVTNIQTTLGHNFFVLLYAFWDVFPQFFPLQYFNQSDHFCHVAKLIPEPVRHSGVTLKIWREPSRHISMIVLISLSEQFQFVSQRHRGFPFSITLYINGIMVARLSSCCEYRYAPGFQQGRKSCFRLIWLAGGIPCYRFDSSFHIYPMWEWCF